MTMTVTRLGVAEDGSPLYHYVSDGHVVITGPITGYVDTSHGPVEVSAPVVEAVDKKHADEIACAIGDRYAREGHPHHTDGTPFVNGHPKAAKL